MRNDNSVFELDFKNAGPLTAEANTSALAVVIDGICLGVWGHSDRRADSIMDLSCSLHGEASAQKVATHLKVKPQRRQHPGHRFLVRWSPEKESYTVGEPVTLKMEISNTGKEPFAFRAGGQQRGPRDNQFRFLAYRSSGTGKAVPDTGDPTNFGGIGSYQTLKPGESFTKSITLDKWFTFTDPDTYPTTGLFELDLYKTSPQQGFGAAIWDDLAVGDCLVRIVPKGK